MDSTVALMSQLTQKQGSSDPQEVQYDFYSTAITVLKSLNDSEKSQHLLEMINIFTKYLNECPYLFCYYKHSNDCNPQVRIGFSEWLLRNLIRFLSQDSISFIHSKCQNYFIEVLEVFQSNELKRYESAFSELVDTLFELREYAEDMYEKGKPQVPYELKSFTENSEKVNKTSDVYKFELYSVNFSSPVSCEYLQARITEIFSKMNFVVTPLVSHQFVKTWKILLLQYIEGPIFLKKASVEAMENIIQTLGIPNLYEILEQVYTATITILRIYFSGEIYSLPNSQLTSLEFEPKFASFLNTLLKSSLNCHDMDIMEDCLIFETLNHITETLRDHKLGNVKSNSLKNATFVAIDDLIKIFVKKGIIVPENTCDNLIKILMAMDQYSAQYKSIVNLMVTIASLFIQNQNETKEENENSRKGIKRKVEETQLNLTLTTQFVKKISSTLPKLEVVEDKLNLLLDKNRLISMSCKQNELNSIRFCLEIITQCAVQILHQNNKNASIILCENDNKSKNFLLPVSTSTSIVNIMKQTLCSSKFNPETYSVIISILEVLITNQDVISLSVITLNDAAVLLSLPWLSMDMAQKDYHDLKIGWFKEKKLDSVGYNLLGDGLKEKCINSLSLLPASTAPMWRIHLLHCALEKDYNGWIKVLPIFLHSTAYFFNISELIRFVTSHWDNRMEETATMVANLICVLSGNSILVREFLKDSTSTLVLKCKICHELDASQKNYDTFSYNWLRDLYFKIQDCESDNVRLLSLKACKPFFNHTKLTSETLQQCLRLIHDPLYDIRFNFIKDVKYLMGNCPNLKDELKQQVVKQVQQTINNAQVEATDEQEALMSSLIQTVGAIAPVVSNDLLLQLLCNLIYNLQSTSVVILFTTRNQLSSVANKKGVKLEELIFNFKEKIGQYLMELMLKRVCDKLEPLPFLKELVDLCGYSNIKSFLNMGYKRYIVVPLICQCSNEADQLINLLSEESKTSKSDMIKENFPFIFVHIVLHTDMKTGKDISDKIFREIGLTIDELVQANFTKTVGALLFHLKKHYEVVYNTLANLALNTKFCKKNPKPIKKKEDMAKFLNTQLLGILSYFDTFLQKSSNSIADKKTALESLIELMALLGPRYVTTVRVKLMGTLRMLIQIKEDGFPKVCCAAWKTFLQNIDVLPLGNLLNQVTAMLLPLLEIEPDLTAEIFKFMIIDKKKELEHFFHDLYFIPEMPQLTEVNNVLKEYVDKPCSQEEVGSLVRHSLKGISHESVDVKIHALSKLRKLLRHHQNALHAHFLSVESIDPLVSDLISSLLDACKETDPKIRLLIVECLGEVGAIDPGRLELQLRTKKQKSKLFLSMDEDDFAYDVIQELLHPVLAVDNVVVQDCSFYALQEMLAIYGCQSKTNALWKRFPVDIQEILSPLLQSRYRTSSEIVKTKISHPICKGPHGKNYVSWVTSWSLDLVHKIKQDKPKRVFSACYNILKHDVNLVLYLLPYLVFYAIQDSTSSEMDEIVLEINAVLGVKPADMNHSSIQVIFTVLDYLKRWNRKFMSKKGDGENPATAATKNIASFLAKISQDLLAKASYHCQAYTRALMHMELYLRANKNEVQDQLGFLQSLYVALDEPDGVAGVSAIRTIESSFQEQILEFEIKGQLNQAFDCYENAVASDPNNVAHHQGLLRCLMELDKSNTALNYASGLLQNKPIDWVAKINPICVEAAWKLSRWDKLSNYLTTESKFEDFGVGVGKILLCAKERNGEQLKKSLQIVRNSISEPLSAAAMEIEGYQRAYSYICKLHMLTDIERSVRLFVDLNDTPGSRNSSVSNMDTDKLLGEWKVRRELLQSSMRFQEPIINLQRVLFTLISNERLELVPQLKEEMSQYWILSAKLARKNGYQQRSFGLLEASSINLPQVFFEKAKLHWTMGDQLKAINILKKGIDEHFRDLSQTLFKNKSPANKENVIPYAKAKLLLTKYSEEAAILESNSLIKMYLEVAQITPDWEEGYFHYAKYLDRIFNSSDKRNMKGDFLKDIISGYGKSLKNGCKHLFHSMPRMLALWFELGTEVVDLQKSKSSSNLGEKQVLLQSITTRILDFLKSLPPYLFLVAFPQLISRICHSHPEVSNALQNIIAQLLTIFPQQAMWMMVSVSKSSYKVRVERCQEIFAKAKNLKPDLDKFISDSLNLADKLLELSNKQVKEQKVFSISSYLRSLPMLVEDRRMSKIILPLQSLMSVTLPTSHGNFKDHNPFPQNFVYIEAFEDSVEILQSLQKPKKITIRGSDGKKYPMMCKPKDDLRKDCRLMEFNNLVNRYLKKDSDARRRHLLIRTYTVVPLNEECGLIEWVPNLMGLRPIVLALYKDKGIPIMTAREIRPILPNVKDSVEKKLEIYKTKFLPRHPAVFSDFFVFNFPDPTSWYFARLAYARTLAVMSMVGYILGLGDRHGENILIDSKSGETFHVDFNCLFNKGETFDWPERVPFRLTHNLVDALGPTGYEGIFRQACESTMRVMRNQTDALMSMLKPFIHDPLLEWGKTKSASKSNTGEITNEKALQHVSDIELRLKGIVKSKNKPLGLPLSIEGQVDYVIHEATDERNLCQMYVGWSAFM